METNGHNGNEHRVSIVYDAPFWIALFESFWEGAYSVAREVIGTSEPTTSEIILFLNVWTGSDSIIPSRPRKKGKESIKPVLRNSRNWLKRR